MKQNKADQYYDAWIASLSLLIIILIVIHSVYTGGLIALVGNFLN